MLIFNILDLFHNFFLRTYIRYDDSILPKWLTYRVSIHVPI